MKNKIFALKEDEKVIIQSSRLYQMDLMNKTEASVVSDLTFVS